MHVRSEYRAKKFAQGGAVVCDTGDVLVMKPPPEVVDDAEDIATANPDIAPEPTVTAALEVAAKYSGGGASMPGLHDEASERDTSDQPRGICSAPICGEVPSWTGRRDDRPGSITLTVEQPEAAKLSGITEVEYGRQLLRLREEKAAGNYIGNGQ